MADRSTQARTVGAQGGAAASAGSADGAALVGVDVGDALVGAVTVQRWASRGSSGTAREPWVPLSGAPHRPCRPSRQGREGREGREGGTRAGNAGCANPTRSGRSTSGRPPSARIAAGRAPGALPSTMPASSPPAATSATTPSPHPARTCRPPRSPRPGTSPSGPRHCRASAAQRRPASVATGSCGHDTPAGDGEGCQGRSGGSAASCSSVRSKSTDEYSRSFVSRW